MALPSSMTTRGGSRYAHSGIELGIFPSTNRALSIELWSATANSTASSIWGKVVFPPTQLTELRHTVFLPLSTRTYHFKARHPAQPGFSAGPFTPTVSGKPVLLPLMPPPPVPFVTFRGNIEVPSGADVFVSSGKLLKVGSQVTAGTLTKRFRVDAAGFIPEQTTHTYQRVSGYIHPNSTVFQILQAAVVLQPGVTMTQLALRAIRPTTAASITLLLQKADSTGGVATVSSVVKAASTAWGTTQSATFSESYSTLVGYRIRVSFRNGSAATSQRARVVWAEVLYTVGDYAKTV